MVDLSELRGAEEVHGSSCEEFMAHLTRKGLGAVLIFVSDGSQLKQYVRNEEDWDRFFKARELRSKISAFLTTDSSLR